MGAALALLIAACGATATATTTTLTSSTPPTVPAATTTSAGSIPAEEAFDAQGHRGARGLQPENTLPAFETALDLGISTLEFDLHFTADGEVVVWHDATISQDKCSLAPGAPVGTPDPDDPAVSDDDLMIRGLDSTQLGEYRCDRNPDPSRFPGQTTDETLLAKGDYSIVTLEELLDFVATYAESDVKTDEQRENASVVRFNMETKRKPKNPENIGDGFDGTQAGPFELRILDIIATYGLEGRVVIQSFDHRSLWAVHELAPTLVLSALSKGGSVDFDELVERGASIWSSDHNDVTEGRLDAAHQAGLDVIPWTVNEPELMVLLMDLGVDGLITDRPDLLLTIGADG
jgi:glycerophosphoryl diester phosphodiesterase